MMFLYRHIATLLLVMSSVVFCASLIHLFVPNFFISDLLEGSEMTMLLLGVAGSLGTGLALLMYSAGAGRRQVAFMVSTALFLASFIRLAYLWMAGFPEALQDLQMIEMFTFFGIAAVLYFIGLGDMKIISRLVDGASSLWGAPRWVFIWVMFILSPVNMAGFFFLDHPLGVAAILGLIYIFFTNIPLLLEARGVNNSMSIPHLIPFGLVVGLAGLYLFTDILPPLEVGSPIYVFAWALLIINAISFAFDLNDSMKWVHGDRDNIKSRQRL